MNWLQKPLKRLLATLLVALLGWGIASCSSPSSSGPAMSKPGRGRLSEVSPPYTIQVLKQALDLNQPQVKILSPRPNQVIGDSQVALKLQVKDLALFKDEDLGLGPYLQILLDSQPYRQVHDSREPVLLENLTPGTHTIRVLAVRPWHESFKNDGAFAQTTFHVFTPTAENNPDPNQPLLTYNYPQGVYGAEPVLLDFFLTNVPLHLVAREDPKDAIPDWKIRCTINGESFTFDRWEPIYLKGLKPGKNWVQLELIDDKDQLLPNVFNSAVQLVTYEPGGTDTLARLTRGELTADAARKIVDPNYVPPVVPPIVPPAPAPEPKAVEVKAPDAEVSQPEISQPEATEPKAVEPQELEPQELESQEPEPQNSQPPAVEPDLPKGAKPSVTAPKLPAPVIAPAVARPEPRAEPEQKPSPKPDLPVQPVEPLTRQPLAGSKLKAPELNPEVELERPRSQPAEAPQEMPAKSDLIRKLQPPTTPEKVVPEAGRYQRPRGEMEPTDREAPFSKVKSQDQPVGRSAETPAFNPLPPVEQSQPIKLPDLERPAPAKLVPLAPPKLNDAPESSRFLQPDDGLDEQLDRPGRSLEPVKPGSFKPSSFKAVEEQLNQVLQPTPVSDSPVRSLETSPGFPGQPSLSPIAPAEPTSDRPDLFGMLDQVKAFFEGLKRPAQDKPLLAPLLNPLPDAGGAGQNLIPDAGEPTIIDTLIDALPEPLRQSVLEELEQPSALTGPY